jgi:predicted DNA-binding transcriptional regulator AlpA
MPDEILTLPEVAQLLKVAEKTVYTMAQRAERHASASSLSTGSTRR